MCPAVLVETRVCGGCSVSRAHKTSLRSILFCIHQRGVHKAVNRSTAANQTFQKTGTV